MRPEIDLQAFAAAHAYDALVVDVHGLREYLDGHFGGAASTPSRSPGAPAAGSPRAAPSSPAPTPPSRDPARPFRAAHRPQPRHTRDHRTHV
jgi:hypothetical protein